MKNFMRILTIPILLGAGGSALALARAAETKPDVALIFKSKCAMCHAPDGKGFSAIHTPDYTDPKWQASVKDKEIAETIRDGKKDTAMKPFKGILKEAEIQAMVAYIRSLNGRKK